MIAKPGVLFSTRENAEISTRKRQLRIEKFEDDSAMGILLHLSAAKSNRNIHEDLSISRIKFGQLINHGLFASFSDVFLLIIKTAGEHIAEATRQPGVFLLQMLRDCLIISAQATIFGLLFNAFLQIRLGRAPLFQLHVCLSAQKEGLSSRFVHFERLIGHPNHVLKLIQIHVTIAAVLIQLNFQSSIVLQLLHLLECLKPFRVAGDSLNKVLRFEQFISLLLAFCGNLEKFFVSQLEADEAARFSIANLEQLNPEDDFAVGWNLWRPSFLAESILGLQVNVRSLTESHRHQRHVPAVDDRARAGFNLDADTVFAAHLRL